MVDNETPSQRKWRLVRERQEAKARERAKPAKRARKTRREFTIRPTVDPDGFDRDNLGESPDF